jgi:hypothetical protein
MPEVQKLFSEIFNVSIKALDKNPDFIDLAQKTLSYVAGFIKHIDNTGKASIYLKFLKDVFKSNLDSISNFTFVSMNKISLVTDELYELIKSGLLTRIKLTYSCAC